MSGYDNVLLSQVYGPLLDTIKAAAAAGVTGGVSSSFKQRVKYSKATCIDPQVKKSLI